MMYLASVIFGFVPYMTERTLTQIKLNKDGYNYNDKNYSVFCDLKDIGKNLFVCLFPVINILKGLKGIIRVINFKRSYADNKMKMLLKDQIYSRKKQNETDEIRDMILTFGEVIGANENEKEQLKQAVDILEMYEFAKDHGYEVDPDFDKMCNSEKYSYLSKMVGETLKLYEHLFYSGYNIDPNFNNMSDSEKLEYLRKASEELNQTQNNNKSIPYNEMNTKEKISYLRREKEDATKSQDNKKPILRRRKNHEKFKKQ